MAVARLQPAVAAVALNAICPRAEGRKAVGPDRAQRPVADVALALVEVGRRAGHHFAGGRDDAREAPRSAQERLVAVEAVVGAGAAPLVVQFDVEQRAQPASERSDAAQLFER